MRKIKLGIIGFGNMGTGHYDNVKSGKCPKIEITAIADTNPDRLVWCKENLPNNIKFFDTAEKLIDSGECDSVLISTPHFDHPSLAIMAMKNNLNVMVEKPAGVYTKLVKKMNEQAQKSDVVFGMMFNQRTNNIYKKMHELVSSGKYGQIRRTNWIVTNWYRPQAYYDSGNWRATWAGEGGGVLLNQCPHQLDLFQWICGMPEKVQAKVLYGKWHNIEVEDDVTAVVTYKNGAIGTFIACTGDACGTNRFEIQLDKAKLVAENDKLELYEYDVAEPEFTKANKEIWGHPNITQTTVAIDQKNSQHVDVMNAFADAVLNGGRLIAGGEEGINGLTLSNAIHLSDWLQKEIELPFDEDLFYYELMKRIKTSKIKTNIKTIYSDTKGTYKGH